MTPNAGRLAVALLAAAAVCAGPAAYADPKIHPGEQLGLVAPGIPDILQQAYADPYAPPAEPACQTVPKELAELDGLLGPDINQPKPKLFDPAKLIGGAVRGAIPYRSVVRLLTGADRKEKKLAQATMAGWARRGFLKGIAARLDCPNATQTAAQAATPQAPAQAPAGLIPASNVVAIIAGGADPGFAAPLAGASGGGADTGQAPAPIAGR